MDNPIQVADVSTIIREGTLPSVLEADLNAALAELADDALLVGIDIASSTSGRHGTAIVSLGIGEPAPGQPRANTSFIAVFGGTPEQVSAQIAARYADAGSGNPGTFSGNLVKVAASGDSATKNYWALHVFDAGTSNPAELPAQAMLDLSRSFMPPGILTPNTPILEDLLVVPNVFENFDPFPLGEPPVYTGNPASGVLVECIMSVSAAEPVRLWITKNGEPVGEPGFVELDATEAARDPVLIAASAVVQLVPGDTLSALAAFAGSVTVNYLNFGAVQ